MANIVTVGEQEDGNYSTLSLVSLGTKSLTRTSSQVNLTFNVFNPDLYCGIFSAITGRIDANSATEDVYSLNLVYNPSYTGGLLIGYEDINNYCYIYCYDYFLISGNDRGNTSGSIGSNNGPLISISFNQPVTCSFYYKAGYVDLTDINFSNLKMTLYGITKP